VNLAETEAIRLGVIGCGHWGPNHIRAFLSLPGALVVRAADPGADRREHVARTHPGIETSAEVAPLLADPSVDAVVIATPAATHFELVRAALHAGKHVLCEKPLCLDSREADELGLLARRRGLVLMTGHIFLFNGGILKLKELISAGELGRLLYATAVRTNLGPIRHDVNVAYDLAAHEVSIFHHLFDAAPLRVAAAGRGCLSPRNEDVAFLTLWYPDGLIASVTASWLSPKKVREITLVGDRKMATWNDLSAGPVSIYDKGADRLAGADDLPEPWYENFGEFQLAVREGDVTIPRVSPEEPLRRQARYFLEAVRRGDAGVCSADRAAAVVRVLEAVSESLRLDGAPVAVAPASASSAPDGAAA
jgi:predicted dehydrogenase